MSKYYTANRSRGLYNPNKKEPFKLSRSKIELFFDCPRCFYIDRRLGTGRPNGFPFNLNNAVDHLLKKEFDLHRAEMHTHPLMEKYGIKAIPFAHEKLDEWRENFVGVRALHEKSNILVFGAVDDIWVTPKRELIVVDYKATSKDGRVDLNADWQKSYKRQMEVYQWLLRRNGFKVSNTGYFVYCNGNRDAEAFDAKLEFDISVLPYVGSDSWVDDTLMRIKECLNSDTIPEANPECDHCAYFNARYNHEYGKKQATLL